MNFKPEGVGTFDPMGIRRMVATMLNLGRPASRRDAEHLISTRLGPYGLDARMLNEEISSYLKTRH